MLSSSPQSTTTGSAGSVKTAGCAAAGYFVTSGVTRAERGDVQVQPIINGVQAALVGQASLAGGDAAVEEAIDHLVAALAPTLRQAAMDLAEQAACEVRAQLPDRTVDLVLADGDPSLRIAEAAVGGDSSSAGELDARITLRIPPSLKSLIEDAADTSGASVNSWVVDALARRARKPEQGRGFRTTHSFDL